MDTWFQSHIKGWLCCNTDHILILMHLAGTRINMEWNGTPISQEATQAVTKNADFMALSS